MDLEIECRRLGKAEFDALRLAAQPRRRLLHVAPAVSKWSAAQHLQHALFHDIAAFKDVEAALAGRPRVETEEALSFAGHAVFTLDMIPRGGAESPEQFLPQSAPTRRELERLFADHRARRVKLYQARARVGVCPTRMPHFALGGMTSAEWIRFARIHLAHHVAIGRECVEAAAVDPKGTR